MMNKHLNITHCPLCGSEQLEPMAALKDHFVTGETFHLTQCKKCGFIMTQDAPVEAEIGRYYEAAAYISHSNTNKGLVNEVYHLVRQYMLRRKAKLVKNASGLQTGRLLDIGTGTGYFPNEMKQLGWQVKATEQNDKARQFANDHFGIDALPANALYSLPANSLDVVTLWHVMEHIEPIDQLWEQIKNVLTDNGTLVVAVPNCASDDAQRYGNEWAAYDVPRHLWHFTPNTMALWAEKHHFNLVKMYPMPFDAFYVSMMSEGYRGHKNTFVRGMIAGAVAWCHALGHVEKSSSIIYILKKK